MIRKTLTLVATAAVLVPVGVGAAHADDDLYSPDFGVGVIDLGDVEFLGGIPEEGFRNRLTVYSSPGAMDLRYAARDVSSGAITTWEGSRQGFKVTMPDGRAYAYLNRSSKGQHWKTSTKSKWVADPSKRINSQYKLSLPLAAVFPWESGLTEDALDGAVDFSGEAVYDEWGDGSITFFPSRESLASGDFTYGGEQVRSASTVCFVPDYDYASPKWRNVCTLSVNGVKRVELSVQTFDGEISVGGADKKFGTADLSKFVGKQAAFAKVANKTWLSWQQMQDAAKVKSGYAGVWSYWSGSSVTSISSSSTYYASNGWPAGDTTIAGHFNIDELFAGYKLSRSGEITRTGRTWVYRAGIDPSSLDGPPQNFPAWVKKSRFWSVCQVNGSKGYAECATSYVNARHAKSMLRATFDR